MAAVERIRHPIGGVAAFVVGDGVVACGAVVEGVDIEIVVLLHSGGQLEPRLIHDGLNGLVERCEGSHLGVESLAVHYSVELIVVGCAFGESAESSGETARGVGRSGYGFGERVGGSAVTETHLGGRVRSCGETARQGCPCRADLRSAFVIKSYAFCWLFTTGAPAG